MTGPVQTSLEKTGPRPPVLSECILMIDHIYIGASDIANEGDWRWEDGSLVVYHDFFSQEPNNFDRNYPSEKADCVAFSRQWSDVYCGRSFPFICQKTW
ncbi:hypothetical protein FSP39_020227 [Pinctada imbricata]|uniref:C-type lectin domain-containing protein n=1 Tax=Pinctada imbricata TaxID=66713 RepID=A0AA88YFR8_PINIB|nr:hypothetical protein FSP39_020227 [Pinctada imbricata]